jgi:hypothetical protein
MKIIIEHDEIGLDFWDYETEIVFLSNHRDYNDQNTDFSLNDFESIEDIKEHFQGKEIVAVNAYIHSGIALSLGSSYPFNCQFDSGVFGFLIFEPGTFGENNCGLSGWVESWGKCLNGEVYYYAIEDDQGEILDSCGGFIGYEHAQEEANAVLKSLKEEARKNRQEKLKQLIKSKVPLIYRRLSYV